MAKQGRGFGVVVLLVTMVIVLMLAAKAWERFGPTAIDVTGAAPGSTHGQPEAAAALEDLPNLDEAKKRTDEHAEEIKKALETLD